MERPTFQKVIDSAKSHTREAVGGLALLTLAAVACKGGQGQEVKSTPTQPAIHLSQPRQLHQHRQQSQPKFRQSSRRPNQPALFLKNYPKRNSCLRIIKQFSKLSLGIPQLVKRASLNFIPMQMGRFIIMAVRYRFQRISL